MVLVVRSLLGLGYAEASMSAVWISWKKGVEGWAMSAQVEFFLSRLYEMQVEEDAIDSVFEFMIGLRKQHDFVGIDEILRGVDLTRIEPSVILSMMTIASWGGGQLKQWRLFNFNVEGHLAKRCGAKRAEKMLEGFDGR